MFFKEVIAQTNTILGSFLGLGDEFAGSPVLAALLVSLSRSGRGRGIWMLFDWANFLSL